MKKRLIAVILTLALTVPLCLSGCGSGNKTVRRFSLNDAAYLSGELMDMSQTELVGSFYNSYIENYRETDGAIRWLPMCAEVDGYMAKNA